MKALIMYSALVTLLPAVVFAAPRTFAELAFLIVDLLGRATMVLVLLGVVVYFFGVSTNILTLGEKGGEKLKVYFFWGIITLFIMVSIWGILRLLQNTIFGTPFFFM